MYSIARANTRGDGRMAYTVVNAWSELAARMERHERAEMAQRAATVRAVHDANTVRRWFVREYLVGGVDIIFTAVELGTNRPILDVEGMSEFELAAKMRDRCPNAVRVLDPHEGRFAS